MRDYFFDGGRSMTSCFELGGLDNARNVMGLVTCGSISDLLAKLSLLPFSLFYSSIFCYLSLHICIFPICVFPSSIQLTAIMLSLIFHCTIHLSILLSNYVHLSIYLLICPFIYLSPTTYSSRYLLNDRESIAGPCRITME